MGKKYKILVVIILIPIILVASFMFFNKENAKKTIFDYIAKQGIEETQLKYAAFQRDLKRGGYNYFVYIEGEKPDIYYQYTYRDKKVSFQAYFNSSKAIKGEFWGGSRLSETEVKKLKYPPLD